jgi:putative ABC transport system permease protein
LGVSLGEHFRIGDADLELRAIIERQPDAAFGALAFGPRVIVSQAALAATGLIRPGALVNYEYRLKLPPGTDAGQLGTAGARELSRYRLADPQQRGRIARIAALYRAGRVFPRTLPGSPRFWSAGSASAMRSPVTSRARPRRFATLKCLGASSRLIFSAYLIQILALALIGIAGGLLLGGLAPAAIAPLVSGLLPVELRLGVYPLPLGLAARCRVARGAGFLAVAARRDRPDPACALFRDTIAPARRPVPAPIAATTTAAALGLAALVVMSAPIAASRCGMSGARSPPLRCSASPGGPLSRSRDSCRGRRGRRSGWRSRICTDPALRRRESCCRSVSGSACSRRSRS